MTGFEVGTQGGLVLLIISVGDDGPGFAATALQMEPDDARALVNGLGSAIKEVSRVRT